MTPLTVLAIAIGNLAPVAGVLFFKWDLFGVLISYVSEQMIAGYFDGLRSIYANPKLQAQSAANPGIRLSFAMLMLLMFAMLGFGLFMSFLDILSGSKGVLSGQIGKVYASVTTASPISLILLGALFAVIQLIKFLKEDRSRALSGKAREATYVKAISRFLFGMVAMVVFGVLSFHLKLPLTVALLVMMLLKLIVDLVYFGRGAMPREN
jgi:hypothetical protein